MELELLTEFIELGVAGLSIGALAFILFNILKDHRRERDEYREERDRIREAFTEEASKNREQHDKAIAVLDKYTEIIRSINNSK